MACRKKDFIVKIDIKSGFSTRSYIQIMFGVLKYYWMAVNGKRKYRSTFELQHIQRVNDEFSDVKEIIKNEKKTRK